MCGVWCACAGPRCRASLHRCERAAGARERAAAGARPQSVACQQPRRDHAARDQRDSVTSVSRQQSEQLVTTTPLSADSSSDPHLSLVTPSDGQCGAHPASTAAPLLRERRASSLSGPPPGGLAPSSTLCTVTLVTAGWAHQWQHHHHHTSRCNTQSQALQIPPVRQQSSPVLQPASPGRAEPRTVASLERTAECRAWRRRGPSAELGPGVRPAQPARRAAAGSEAAAAGQQREECPGQAARPSPTVTTQQTPW